MSPRRKEQCHETALPIAVPRPVGFIATPAFADGPRPVPEPYPNPPSPVRPIPGPCPPPHTDIEKPEKAPTPRPDPFIRDIRVPGEMP